MQMHTPTFFLLVGTLAGGGAAGYFASQQNVFGKRPDSGVSKEPSGPATSPSVPAAAVASSAPSVHAAEVPACDDSVGSPGACPPPGSPVEEGGCGMAPVKRCNDYKKAFKPKVAERAVACLNGLKWNERCDPLRLHLCGHLSLMNACAAPREAEGSDTAATPGTIAASCDAIVKGCATAPFSATMPECREILAGMNDVGRAGMVDCMKTHCTDKGLLQCEASFD